MNRSELLAKRSEKYSFRDFTNKDLRDATDLDGSVIIGSCFYQVFAGDPGQDPLRHIFPEGMSNVIFLECNLDNVSIPPGNTTYSCVNRRIARMNDGEYWFLGTDLKPTTPIHKKRLVALGENVNPHKIPSEPISAEELRRKRQEHALIERDSLFKRR